MGSESSRVAPERVLLERLEYKTSGFLSSFASPSVLTTSTLDPRPAVPHCARIRSGNAGGSRHHCERERSEGKR